MNYEFSATSLSEVGFCALQEDNAAHFEVSFSWDMNGGFQPRDTSQAEQKRWLCLWPVELSAVRLRVAAVPREMSRGSCQEFQLQEATGSPVLVQLWVFPCSRLLTKLFGFNRLGGYSSFGQQILCLVLYCWLRKESVQEQQEERSAVRSQPRRRAKCPWRAKSSLYTEMMWKLRHRLVWLKFWC